MKSFLRIFITLLVLTALMTGCNIERQKSAIADYDYSKMRLVQLEEPDEGRPVAVITTTLGIIKVALYPEYAPNTVANFIVRIEEGFYDDSPILAVQKDEKKNPVLFRAGENSEKQIKEDDNGLRIEVENEYSVNMWPFKGAVGSYGEFHGAGDSRFFIVNGQPLNDNQIEKMRKWAAEDGTQLLPDELIGAFEEVGVAVTLSGLHTIFGQTIEGMEVAEAICSVEVDKRSQPKEEIRIISVKLEYYKCSNSENN